MIHVTRLDGSDLVLNCELLETVERTPDTVITLFNGHKLVVKESVDEIVARVIRYRREMHQCPLLVERTWVPTGEPSGDQESRS